MRTRLPSRNVVKLTIRKVRTGLEICRNVLLNRSQSVVVPPVDNDCFRITEDGIFRILENDDFRILEQCGGDPPVEALGLDLPLDSGLA